MEFSKKTSVFKRVFLFFIVQCAVSLILFSLHWSRGINVQDTQLFESKVTPEGTSGEPSPIILIWTWPFGYNLPLNKCPRYHDSPGCFYTDNRSFYSMADAVVLHHRELCLLSEKLPEIPRPSKQYWVWFNMESPTYSPNLNLMDNVINLTMSYRADSDIFTPYGFLEKYNGAQQFVIPVKTNLLAWVVSNWEPYSRRIQYYEELKKYIQIDLYGKNYKKLPPENHTKIISMYKFYLAFENSIHEDYITEKLWYNALSSGTVPVVMGPPRENYERFIPSDSFIHVDDFSTAQDLALYLQELDKNDTRYKQYFRWRSTLQPVINTDFFTLYCKICKALKEAPAYRTIKSIAKWYK